MNTKRGFTLIELLVVIAIIGILAAIVLASVSSARSKGNDAKIQEQMHNLQTAAAEYSSSNSSGYGTATGSTNACVSPPTVGMWADSTSGMLTLADPANYPTGTTMDCYSTASAYAADAKLSTGQYWCVDSTGQSKSESAALVAGTTVCT